MYENNDLLNADISCDNFNVTRHAPKSPRPKKRRNKKTLRLLSVILSGSLICSSFTFCALKLYNYIDSNIPSSAAQTVKTLEVVYDDYIEEIATSNTETNNVLSISPLSTTKTLLTPTELYTNNVSACVGIIVSNVSTNAFGQTSTAASSGSGFVITADGYIVTNCHVIADVIDSSSLTIDVSFYDGSSYPATLVGYEEDNDVAVLKIEATNLQTIELGDSDLLEVGESVYAIGNPLGELTFSLTDGLVSALDRLITASDGTTMNMFQTNTAINPGNSGGPLFNAYGEVIGITTAKYSTSSSGTTVEGLGFALPINDVVNIVVDLMEYGYVTGKPYMGVQVVNAEYYGFTAGAAISFIAEDSAAENAGLMVSDVITAIDNTSIDSSSALTAALTAYSAGDSAVLTVVRDDETIYITIFFDEKNTDTEAANQIDLQEETTTQYPSYSDQMPMMPPQR